MKYKRISDSVKVIGILFEVTKLLINSRKLRPTRDLIRLNEPPVISIQDFSFTFASHLRHFVMSTRLFLLSSTPIRFLSFALKIFIEIERGELRVGAKCMKSREKQWREGSNLARANASC